MIAGKQVLADQSGTAAAVAIGYRHLTRVDNTLTFDPLGHSTQPCLAVCTIRWDQDVCTSLVVGVVLCLRVAYSPYNLLDPQVAYILPPVLPVGPLLIGCYLFPLYRNFLDRELPDDHPFLYVAAIGSNQKETKYNLLSNYQITNVIPLAMFFAHLAYNIDL